jgi:hypothetical protein
VHGRRSVSARAAFSVLATVLALVGVYGVLFVCATRWLQTYSAVPMGLEVGGLHAGSAAREFTPHG